MAIPDSQWPVEARSPTMLGTEPPSHNGLQWPQLVTTSAMGPACPVVASPGPQGCLLEGNTAFYRLWAKGITGSFFFPLLPFPLFRCFGVHVTGFFPFPFLRQFQLSK